MGLDIAFNRKQAIEAGLVLTKERNGTDDAIARAKELGDTEYLKYLNGVSECVKVPGANHLVYSGGSTDDIDIIVRANKWGRTYAPLTQWLKANNIEWSEF